MRTSISLASFLSGNLPICAILLVSVVFKYFSAEKVLVPLIFAGCYTVICLISTGILLYTLKSAIKELEIKNGGNYGRIQNIKIQNIFSSGTMTYYILPFISFAAGDDLLKNEIILFILILILGKLYVQERMIIYTPILGLVGYIVLAGRLLDSGHKELGETLLLIKNPNQLVLGPREEYDIIYKRVSDYAIMGIIDLHHQNEP